MLFFWVSVSRKILRRTPSLPAYLPRVNTPIQNENQLLRPVFLFDNWNVERALLALNVCDTCYAQLTRRSGSCHVLRINSTRLSRYEKILQFLLYIHFIMCVSFFPSFNWSQKFCLFLSRVLQIYYLFYWFRCWYIWFRKSNGRRFIYQWAGSLKSWFHVDLLYLDRSKGHLSMTFARWIVQHYDDIGTL